MNWRADELDTDRSCSTIFCSCISKDNIITGGLHMAFLNSNWKDKRVAAINRVSFRRGWSSSENNPYFDQYTVIMDPKIKTKKQMKKELRIHGYK